MKIVQGCANIDSQVVAGIEDGDNEDKNKNEILLNNCQTAAEADGIPVEFTAPSVPVQNNKNNSSEIRTSANPISSEELEQLSKLETHWGCFGVGEKVFAFWKGKTAFSTGYYSGTIIKKGVLNVYNIHFDDETVSNTSEVQILPVRVLGVGVKVFYLSDEEGTGPVSACVLGQKFEGDPEKVSGDDVEYAIEVFGSPASQTLMCARRQLYLGPNQAKDLRKKYDSVQPKLGDLNLDNIVTGPRRRGRGFEPPPDSDSVPSEDEKPLKKPERRTKSLSSKSSSSPLTPEKNNNNNNNVRKRVRSSLPSAEASDSTPPPAKTKLMSDGSSKKVKGQSPDGPPILTKQEPIVQKAPAEIQASVQKVSTGQQAEVNAIKGANNNKSKVSPGASSPKKLPVASNPKVAGASTKVPVASNSKVPGASNAKVPAASSPKKLPGAPSSKVPGASSSSLPDIVQSNAQPEANKSPGKLGLFRGYYFYLTSGDREFMKGLGLGNYAKEISKGDMQSMIKSQSGTEILRVGDERGKDPARVFLLASSHLRTLKYLYCIATGIPCVAQKWIADSIEAKEVLDWTKYRLSPGWCMEENRLGDFHANRPLEGMRVGICTFKNETIATWKVLIPAAKATLLISKEFHHEKHPPELKVPEAWLNGGPLIDILVSDFYCPDEVASMLKSKGIPLVRIEWLVQTIIMGKKASIQVGETAQQQHFNQSRQQVTQQSQQLGTPDNSQGHHQGQQA